MSVLQMDALLYFDECIYLDLCSISWASTESQRRISLQQLKEKS